MLEVVLLSNEEVIGTMTIVRTVPSIPLPRGRGKGTYQVRVNSPKGVAGPVELRDFDRSRGSWALVQEAINRLLVNGMLFGGPDSQTHPGSPSKPPVVHAVAEPEDHQPEPA